LLIYNLPHSFAHHIPHTSTYILPCIPCLLPYLCYPLVRTDTPRLLYICGQDLTTLPHVPLAVSIHNSRSVHHLAPVTPLHLPLRPATFYYTLWVHRTLPGYRGLPTVPVTGGPHGRYTPIAGLHAWLPRTPHTDAVPSHTTVCHTPHAGVVAAHHLPHIPLHPTHTLRLHAPTLPFWCCYAFVYFTLHGHLYATHTVVHARLLHLPTTPRTGWLRTNYTPPRHTWFCTPHLRIYTRLPRYVPDGSRSYALPGFRTPARFADYPTAFTFIPVLDGP